jgi:hypothetical protein
LIDYERKLSSQQRNSVVNNEPFLTSRGVSIPIQSVSTNNNRYGARSAYNGPSTSPSSSLNPVSNSAHYYTSPYNNFASDLMEAMPSSTQPRTTTSARTYRSPMQRSSSASRTHYGHSHLHNHHDHDYNPNVTTFGSSKLYRPSTSLKRLHQHLKDQHHLLQKHNYNHQPFVSSTIGNHHHHHHSFLNDTPSSIGYKYVNTKPDTRFSRY